MSRYQAIEISTDHKPDQVEEERRIVDAGGRVFNWGVPRIWLRDVSVPGLAISRSFGDTAAHSVGVTALPEIKAFELDASVAFIILATDGVFQFISSQQAADICARFHASEKSPQEAVDTLVDEATKRWHAEETSVDDITAIVIYNTAARVGRAMDDGQLT